MIFGSAATVAGLPIGALCMSTTGWSCVPPAWARLRMRLTQKASPEPLAFQSSVSTDQVQKLMPRAWARLRVVLLYAPYGGRNTQGAEPTRLTCCAVASSIWAACTDAVRVDMSGCDQV